jgi:hypothetical protein
MSAIARCVQRITGFRPSRSTLWRWHLKGRLKTIRVGGRLFATETAIREMLAQDEMRNLGSRHTRADAAVARLEREFGSDPRRNHVA